ncbi:hypothetical protein AOQ84DRAFT_364805 [Glonium stellatum]|uniref:Uncharacterized protein n=1 Tax=Glonium stellatum TaxID=574774 RepID=A0A8E2EZT2_9PEZI|nr:hypothetical protein AOQ84DRAFT_364805 [Glonium stellatum]
MYSVMLYAQSPQSASNGRTALPIGALQIHDFGLSSHQSATPHTWLPYDSAGPNSRSRHSVFATPNHESIVPSNVFCVLAISYVTLSSLFLRSCQCLYSLLYPSLFPAPSIVSQPIVSSEFPPTDSYMPVRGTRSCSAPLAIGLSIKPAKPITPDELHTSNTTKAS